MFKNKTDLNKGEISFGAEIIIFIVILFIFWLVIGNHNTNSIDKPFIKDSVIRVQ